MLENMGVRVISERPYELALPDESITWVQDFELIHAGDQDVEAIKENFQEQFARVWRGEAENDGFNRLVLGAGLNWRQTMLLRAYCKYLLQTSLTFSPAYMERTLAGNPQIAALLVKYFEARHDPRGAKERDALIARYTVEIDKALESVSSLDDDRILRSSSMRCAPPSAQIISRRSNTVNTNRTFRSSLIPLKYRNCRYRGPCMRSGYTRRVSKRASAQRQGGARRHTLVGPARGFPHRGVGSHEGTAGEKHRDRAGRLQRRLLCETAATR